MNALRRILKILRFSISSRRRHHIEDGWMWVRSGGEKNCFSFKIKSPNLTPIQNRSTQ
jgi:hypothetical protein